MKALFIGQSYIDVTFFPSRGETLDGSSIIDSPTEFSLGGVGAGLPAKRVAVVGAPSAMGNNVYRYYLENDFVLGAVTVDFDAGAWTIQGPATSANSCRGCGYSAMANC